MTPEVGRPQNATAFGGLWFANDTTLYIADAGNSTDAIDGTNYSAAAAQNLAGIQKWSLSNGTWTYDDTLPAGLDLGVPHHVDGLPTGANHSRASRGTRPWTAYATRSARSTPTAR